jgi:hypothetical protein
MAAMPAAPPPIQQMAAVPAAPPPIQQMAAVPAAPPPVQQMAAMPAVPAPGPALPPPNPQMTPAAPPVLPPGDPLPPLQTAPAQQAMAAPAVQRPNQLVTAQSQPVPTPAGQPALSQLVAMPAVQAKREAIVVPVPPPSASAALPSPEALAMPVAPPSAPQGPVGGGQVGEGAFHGGDPGFMVYAPAPAAADETSGAQIHLGAGLYIVKPCFTCNPAFVVATGNPVNPVSNSGSFTSATRSQDFDYSLSASPRLYLDYTTDSGLGVRGCWWRFDQNTSCSLANSNPQNGTFSNVGIGGFGVGGPFVGNGFFGQPHVGSYMGSFAGPGFVPANPNDRLNFSNSLLLDVYDFEAIQSLNLCRSWSLLLGGGVRYAHLAQNYTAARVNTPGSTGLVEFPTTPLTLTTFTQDMAYLTSGHNFEGIGPVVTVEGRWSVGETGLALYGTSQAATLCGHSKLQASAAFVQTGVSAGEPVNESSSDSASTGSRNCVMPVLEMEIGAEYSPGWDGLNAFLRAGLVGQVWFGAGTATTDGGNLGFLGLSVMAGATF